MSAPSIVFDMPEAEYHARPEVSKHDLDLLRRAPLLYRYRKDNPEEPDEEMNFGSLVHLALLQPHLLESAVAFLPEKSPQRPTIVQINNRLTGKPDTESAAERFGFWDKWDAENKGKQIVTPQNYEHVLGIQKSIMANPDTARYFDHDPGREVSLFWEREITVMKDGARQKVKVPCRARLDLLRSVEIGDIKTTGDAQRSGFSRDMAKHRYSHQGEHYIDGAKANGYNIRSFVMIAVETKPPYLCTDHSLGESSLEVAKQENLRDLRTFWECSESGIWPNIKSHPQPLEAPIYGFDQ